MLVKLGCKWKVMVGDWIEGEISLSLNPNPVHALSVKRLLRLSYPIGVFSLIRLLKVPRGVISNIP